MQDRSSGLVVIVFPESFQALFVQKCRGEIRLWIEIAGEHLMTHIGQHPSEVIHERSLADAALIVEESQHWDRHGFIYSCFRPVS